MIQTIQEKKERFRVIPTQQVYSPFEIDLTQYEVYGYLLGERVDKCKGLTLDHFDSLQVIKESNNRLNKREFVHCIGHRISNKEFTILILKLKK